MKIKRYKKVHKYLQFYRTNYGFHAPYQILIDGTFCQRALKNKVNIKEQLPKYLGDEIAMFTTVCIINETQNIGREVYGAFRIVKQFGVRKCGHSESPLKAADCIRSMVGKDNKDHYIVASTDLVLTKQLREIPGCPLLYLKANTVNLEPPSKISIEGGSEIKRKLVGSDEGEIERLKELKKEILGSRETTIKRKRKKGPKGPNPLSCKKKMKTEIRQNLQKNDTENVVKRRRKKKTKFGHIVQQVINSFNTEKSEEN